MFADAKETKPPIVRTYHADDQVTDDKDQCDGKGAGSRRKPMLSNATSWVSDVFKTRYVV